MNCPKFRQRQNNSPETPDPVKIQEKRNDHQTTHDKMTLSSSSSSSADLTTLWSVLSVLLLTGLVKVTPVVRADTTGTIYTKKPHTRIAGGVDSPEFPLSQTPLDRTSCVVACAAHAQCSSVNFRSGTSECLGSSKGYYSFDANPLEDSGIENFSPEATEVRDGEWILAFRAQAGVDTSYGDALFLQAWAHPSSLSSEDLLGSMDPACYSATAGNCQDFYRSRLMAEWPQDVDQVRLAFYTGGSLSMEMIFDGTGSSSNEDWFSTDRLLSSPWTDLMAISSSPVLSVPGQLSSARMFVAVEEGFDDDDCNTMEGWLMVHTKLTSICPFDQYSTLLAHSGNPRSPQFLYSTTGSKILFADQTFGMADVMAMFIKLQ